MDVFGSIPNPFGTFTLSGLLNNTITLAFIIAFILVFFFLVFGGIKWIISGGDQKQVESARNMITAAIVGLAIVALAYATTRILETFFNVKIFGGVDIPTATSRPAGGGGTTGNYELPKDEP